MNTTTVTASASINFAQQSGIDSVAGAVIFAILYVPLFFFFVRQAIARPTYVYIMVALFAAVRITAFSLRAFLAGSSKAAHDLSIFLAYDIIYNVGFFGVLYSTYTLVLDRGRLSDAPLPSGPIATITRRPFLFRLALMAAVIVGIVGAIEVSSGTSTNSINLGTTLRKVSTVIFLILAILVVLLTVMLIRSLANYGTYKVANDSFGATYGVQILAVISLLLLIREAFFAATMNNLTLQDKEIYWYPAAATTEFLAVVLFAAPGLVPSREELPS